MSVVGDVKVGPPGPAVLLLHSLAMDRTLWRQHVGALSDKATVITCDLPGHGASAPVVTTSIEEMADSAAAFVREHHDRPVVVAGLSLGGCVAQALTVRHPDVVAALLLADTTAWYGPTAKIDWAARAERARREGLADLAAFQLARWFSSRFLEENPAMGQALLDVFTANDVDSYSAVCAAMGAMDLRSEVGRINVPTTVLVGELDPATPLPHAEDLVNRINGSRLVVLPGASHLSPVERPETFLSELEALLHNASEEEAPA